MSTPRLGPTEASFAYDVPFVVKNNLTGKALQAPEPGAPVRQEGITAAADQQWMLRAGEDGSQLVSLATRQCLRVPDSGSKVQQRPCDGGRHEHWYIYNAPSGGVALRSVVSDLCLGVNRSSTDGAPAVHVACTWDPTDDQVWRMVRLA